MARRKRAPSARELDPHQQREAKKYANPIPSREFILQTLTDHGAPLAFEEVAQALSLTEEEDRIALERRAKKWNHRFFEYPARQTRNRSSGDAD